MAAQPQSLPGLLKRVLAEALPPDSDRQLLDRFAESGDETAFAAILDRHGPMLHGMCRQWLGDAHLAEDVTQATFLVLARNARAIRRRDSLAGWLYRVAQRLARKARLTEAARSRRERRAADERGEPTPSDPGWAELMRILDEELQRLPERLRVPLLLCYLEGRTRDEAAGQLGWSLSTLRRRLDKGRELLRVRMTRRGATLGAGLVAGFLATPPARAALAPAFRQAILTTAAGVKGGAIALSVWALAQGGMRAWTDDRTLGLTLAVSPDGKTLATLNEDGIIRLWDRETGKEKHLPEASPCALEAVCFRPDGKTIATVGHDFALREWDAATGRLLGRPRAIPIGFQPAFAAGGKLLMTYYAKDKDTSLVRLHDPISGQLLREEPGFWPAVSPDAKRLAVIGTDRRVRVLDIDTGRVLQALAPPAEEQMPDALGTVPRGFTADGQSLILQGENLSVWDVRTGNQEASWKLRTNHVLEKPAKPEQHSWERIESIAVSPDGKKVAFALLKDRPGQTGPRNWFGRVMLLETLTGKLLQQIDVEDESFPCLAFSPDGRLLAAGGAWTARVWDVAIGKAAGVFEGHRGPVTSLAFSPDGKRLASASADSTVLVWRVSW